MNYTNPYMPNYFTAQMNTMQQTSNINGINWVQGVEGAKAWQLTPNSNVMLLDSENDGIFYIKTSDNVGMCTLRTFKYEEITNLPNQTQIDLSNYVRKEDLQAEVTNMVNSLMNNHGGYKNEQSVSANKQRTNKTIAK